ncbi:hypothetical protein HPB47_002736 [Ixodes persulcatus]|uniref:Uncharacterized protein n=1 Tax=Ixodes persulcatus TaxID=34615 RepID=A0AC60PKG6_IXOPE|nr:hypothetical protein HPB47_002736 [Ixodes persulcatus]
MQTYVRLIEIGKWLKSAEVAALADRFDEGDDAKSEISRQALRAAHTTQQRPLLSKKNARTEGRALNLTVPPVKCLSCKEMGHFSRDCPRKTEDGGRRINSVVGYISTNLTPPQQSISQDINVNRNRTRGEWK